MSPQQAAPGATVTGVPMAGTPARPTAAVVSPSPVPPPHGVTTPKGWSAASLRPSPPLRPTLGLSTTGVHLEPYVRYGGKPSDTAEDGLIFDVIETYYALAKPRHTVNSGGCLKRTVPVSITGCWLYWCDYTRVCCKSQPVLPTKLFIITFLQRDLKLCTLFHLSLCLSFGGGVCLSIARSVLRDLRDAQWTY